MLEDVLVGQEIARRRATHKHKSQVSAECQCYDLDLTCFHTMKERTTSLGDSTSWDAKSADGPAWRRHHSVTRRQNSQRVNCS